MKTTKRINDELTRLKTKIETISKEIQIKYPNWQTLDEQELQPKAYVDIRDLLNVCVAKKLLLEWILNN